MWTTENRARYDRCHLRYESDLTDEEWAEIAPQIPAAKRAATSGLWKSAKWRTASCISSARIANGTRSRRICRRRARCATISIAGATTTRLIAFITHFT